MNKIKVKLELFELIFVSSRKTLTTHHAWHDLNQLQYLHQFYCYTIYISYIYICTTQFFRMCFLISLLEYYKKKFSKRFFCFPKPLSSFINSLRSYAISAAATL
jgi:hypothetical protein